MRFLSIFAFNLFAVLLSAGSDLPAGLEKYSKVLFQLSDPRECGSLDCVRLNVLNRSGAKIEIDDIIIKLSLIVSFSIKYEDSSGNTHSKGFCKSYPISTSYFGHRIPGHEHENHMDSVRFIDDKHALDIGFIDLFKSTLRRFKQHMPADFVKISSVRVGCLLSNPFHEIRIQEDLDIDLDFVTRPIFLPVDMVYQLIQDEKLF